MHQLTSVRKVTAAFRSFETGGRNGRQEDHAPRASCHGDEAVEHIRRAWDNAAMSATHGATAAARARSLRCNLGGCMAARDLRAQRCSQPYNIPAALHRPLAAVAQ